MAHPLDPVRERCRQAAQSLVDCIAELEATGIEWKRSAGGKDYLIKVDELDSDGKPISDNPDAWR